MGGGDGLYSAGMTCHSVIDNLTGVGGGWGYTEPVFLVVYDVWQSSALFPIVEINVISVRYYGQTFAASSAFTMILNLFFLVFSPSTPLLFKSEVLSRSVKCI